MGVSFPPKVRIELEGWTLVWAALERDEGAPDTMDQLWRDRHEELRSRFADRALTDERMVGEIRALFRKAGCDPTRYRPSSEALARRVLKGDQLPRINTMVDVNNLLSLDLLAPCCVINPGSVDPPFELRSGRSGERMESMRGDFKLDNKVLLEDSQGPFGTPITDSERVRVNPDCTEAWMVAYLPGGVGRDRVAEALDLIIAEAPLRLQAHIEVS